MSQRRRTWFLIRLAIYVAVVAVLYAVRGAPDWQAIRQFATGRTAGDSLLTIAGADLAPWLVEPLVEHYRRDYPALAVRMNPGGTNQALEDLMNRRADVAFLYRPPTAAEQAQLRQIDGDTAVVVPVAIGAVTLISSARTDTVILDLDAIRELLLTGQTASCERLYVPDPNDGLWDAARLRLGAPDQAGPHVVFLADAAAVADAVASDTNAWGLVSSFTVDLARDSRLTAQLLRGDLDAEPARPTSANLVNGRYPLYHWLYAACRGRGGIEGAKFVTHLASARGQRQVQRVGAVPAQQVAREIIITREPPGD